MINSVLVSDAFKRDAKRLLKKYRTLKGSIDGLMEGLSKNPFLGVSYGNDIYKIRLADPSKGGGKSGAFRIMYYHLNKTEAGIVVLLLFIYDKSEKSTIRKDEVLKKLGEILTSYKSTS